jgi:DNA-binding transcriptional LysR family regulator
VVVQVHAWGRHRAPPGLAAGELDLAVGVFVPDDSRLLSKEVRKRWPSSNAEPLPSGHHLAPLFELGIATIVRADHPRVGKQLDLDTFCALDHVLVTEEPWANGVVDDVLARMRRKRRIVVRVPRLLGVGAIVAATDLCASIDARLAWVHSQTHALRLLVPPLTVPEASLSMIWHDRTHRDPARQWLREHVLAVGGLCAKHGARAGTKHASRATAR